VNDKPVLHVSPAEANEFVQWALLNNVFDDHLQTVLQAFAESRRAVYRDVKEWCAEHHKELRVTENCCTPAESDKREIVRHKADKMDNVIHQLQLMERGE
jgi:hypothetical protein